MVNAELARYAVKRRGLDVSDIQADIHYPTESPILWVSYRVLSMLLGAVRTEEPGLCPHRFNGRKPRRT